MIMVVGISRFTYYKSLDFFFFEEEHYAVIKET